MNNSSLNILGNQNSLFNQFISEIRNSDVQSDSLRFRRNLERIGEIFAYEISKNMAYAEQEVVTPLGIANVPRLQEKPVLATILRAGLPLHQGSSTISTTPKTPSSPLSGSMSATAP